jgi:hypothetical protein
MEVTMPDSVNEPGSVFEQWQKELQVLLAKIEQHPSADLTVERDRVAVLNALIAKRSKASENE